MLNRRRFMESVAAGGLGLQWASFVTADDLQGAIGDVQQRMVKIFGAGGLAGLHAYGTGFLISPDGHIATVLSHVLDSDNVSVVLHDGRKLHGKVIGTDVELDLAIIKIEAEGLPFFDLFKAVDVSPGTRVLAFSNMFKVASGNEPVTVQRGVVSAKAPLAARRGRFAAPYRGPAYLVDAVTNNPGAGGGVLTTLDGRLIGVLGRELKNPQTQTWINYTVPASKLASTADAIMKGQFKPKDKFAGDQPEGSGVTAVDLGVVLVPDVVSRTPAYIDDVVAASPAAKAGLQSEDLIVFVNSDLVASISAVTEALGRVQPGDDINLTVRRGDDL
ncbi:serine protease, partial [Planctomyces sp. SCGC AG-212-M04]